MWPFKSKAEKCIRAYVKMRKADLIEQENLPSEKHVAVMLQHGVDTYVMKGSRCAPVSDLVHDFVAIHGYGESYRSAYADLLSHLAEHENMRDTESFIGWIEMCSG